MKIKIAGHKKVLMIGKHLKEGLPGLYFYPRISYDNLLKNKMITTLRLIKNETKFR